MAALPANTDGDVPVIGFLALHLDAATQITREKCKTTEFAKTLTGTITMRQ